MRKLTVLVGLLLPALVSATPVVQVCDQSGNCAPVSATNGIAVDAKGTVPVSLLPAGATRFSCGLAGLGATLTECQALAAARVYYITDIVVGTTTATAGTYGVQVGT